MISVFWVFLLCVVVPFNIVVWGCYDSKFRRSFLGVSLIVTLIVFLALKYFDCSGASLASSYGI